MVSIEDDWDKFALLVEGREGRCGSPQPGEGEPQQAAATEEHDSSRASPGITPSMSSLEGEDILLVAPPIASSRFSSSPRESVSGKNECGRIINALIRVGLSKGRMALTRADLHDELHQLLIGNLVDDGDVERKSVFEARRKGVLDDLMDFDPAAL